MSKKFDIVIIGGGLGGLLSANILSREGLRVCIVEQGKKLGGSIQSFARDKTIFNTGLNYTESLGDGEVLNQYFKYFKIMDRLKIKQLDTDAFNKISFSDEATEYPYAQGHNNFIQGLAEYFPKSNQSLKKYLKTLESVCNSFPLYSLDPHSAQKVEPSILYKSSHEFLKSIDPDPKLQQVLGGMNPLFGARKDKTPLYVHALINYSFIKSSWRLVDGSSQLASSNAKVIKENGGEIYYSKRVCNIGGDNKQVKFVNFEDGDRFYADKIISNIHPSSTLEMLAPDLNKKIYKERISNLKNTIGMFTVYITLKEKSFPYLNFNHHYYSKLNTWTSGYNINSWPEHYFLYTPAISKSNEWADGLVAMTYMDYDEVSKWEGTSVEQRGEEYELFKQKKADLLIDSIEKKFPQIRKVIKNVFTSTPLTYRDYTGTPQGSSYGIEKDFNDPFSTIITPKSRIKNLYFTGQNLNIHGILGVTVSAVLTCSEILGRDYLIKKIKDA